MTQSDPAGRLTEEQRTRVDFAQQTLNAARGADLIAASAVDLVVMVEQLRGALHESLRVISELTE